MAEGWSSHGHRKQLAAMAMVEGLNAPVGSMIISAINKVPNAKRRLELNPAGAG
jgi:hypothetical protein